MTVRLLERISVIAPVVLENSKGTWQAMLNLSLVGEQKPMVLAEVAQLSDVVAAMLGGVMIHSFKTLKRVLLDMFLHATVVVEA